jgi:hypothetical protein
LLPKTEDDRFSPGNYRKGNAQTAPIAKTPIVKNNRRLECPYQQATKIQLRAKQDFSIMLQLIIKSRSRQPNACSDLVEEGGFEPPKLVATDLQSAPFGHSGTLPYETGAGGRIRTGNLLITNQLLCH